MEKKEPALPPAKGTEEKKEKKSSLSIAMAIGWILTGIALSFNAKSLINTEKWKRVEFVRTQYKEFGQAPSVVFFNKIFDYKQRAFCFPDSPRLCISQYQVAKALYTNEQETDSSGMNIRIRDVADDYLTRLGDFYRHYQSGLMSKDNIDYYVSYYLLRMAGNLEESYCPGEGLVALKDSLKHYINFYKYNDVQKLFCLYGYNIIDNDSCKCKENSKYRKDTVEKKLSLYQKIMD